MVLVTRTIFNDTCRQYQGAWPTSSTCTGCQQFAGRAPYRHLAVSLKSRNSACRRANHARWHTIIYTPCRISALYSKYVYSGCAGSAYRNFNDQQCSGYIAYPFGWWSQRSCWPDCWCVPKRWKRKNCRYDS